MYCSVELLSFVYEFHRERFKQHRENCKRIAKVLRIAVEICICASAANYNINKYSNKIEMLMHLFWFKNIGKYLLHWKNIGMCVRALER